jgi:hypothetical protein
MSNAIKAAQIWTMTAESAMQNAIEAARIGDEISTLEWANRAWEAEQEVQMLEDLIPEDNLYYWDLLGRAEEASNKARLAHDEMEVAATLQ